MVEASLTTGGAVFFVAAMLILLIALVWRLISHRHALPCPAWLSWLVEIKNPFFKIYDAGRIVNKLYLQPGMKVLDLGCGPGRVAIPAARMVGETGQVTAVDMQPGMLQKAEQKAKAAGLDNIRFVEARSGEGKLGADLYDRALLVTVLGEIPEQEAALREVFAALRKGGILSVTEIIVDPHFQGRGKVARLAVGSGFREKEFFGNRFAFTLHLEKP
jgi:2-polyprenyl-3-methyl-5-hydroxy-6-metoxy-1,4-benzoquinol methylase